MRLPLIVLALCAGLGPFAAHSIVALLPMLQQAFDVSYGEVQLTVAAYLAALACGQLVVGIASGRLGRRRVLLLGLGVFVAASLAMGLSTNIATIVALRFVQGFAGSTGMVVALSVIGSQSGPRLAVRAAALMMVLSVATMVSPLIGSLIGESAGWQAVFLATACVGAACMAFAAVVLDEASLRAPRALGGGTVLATLAAVMRDRVFAVHASLIALSICNYFFALAALPFLAQYLLGLSAVGNGAWMLLVGTALPIGAYVAGLVAPAIGVRRSILLAASVQLSAAIMLLVLALTGVLTPLCLFGATAVLAGAATWLVTNAQAVAVSSKAQAAGTAAGLSGAMQFGAGALGAVIGGIAVENAGPPLALAAVAVIGSIVLALAVAGAGR